MTNNDDPYRDLFDQIVSEWERESDEDALYRRFYPDTQTNKETN